VVREGNLAFGGDGSDVGHVRILYQSNTLLSRVRNLSAIDKGVGAWENTLDFCEFSPIMVFIFLRIYF